MRLSKILVPVEFCETCTLALTYALHLAKALDARVYVLHVRTSEREPEDTEGATLAPAQDKMQAFVAAAPAAAKYVEQTVQVWAGKAAPEILKLATELNVDLIVMGTRQRSVVVRALLGSVADSVVRASTCPVLTVPPVVTKDDTD